MAGEHAVGRVIARPFEGEPGDFHRREGRRDYAAPPPGRSYLEELQDAGRAGARGRQDPRPVRRAWASTRSTTAPPTRRGSPRPRGCCASSTAGLIFVNLVDTDQVYGHRHDVEGFHAALREIDAAVADWLELLGEDDLLVLTADHGVDPDAPHTDHTREYAPLLARLRGPRRPPPRRPARRRGRERAALADRARRAGAARDAVRLSALRRVCVFCGSSPGARPGVRGGGRRGRPPARRPTGIGVVYGGGARRADGRARRRRAGRGRRGDRGDPAGARGPGDRARAALRAARGRLDARAQGADGGAVRRLRRPARRARHARGAVRGLHLGAARPAPQAVRAARRGGLLRRLAAFLDHAVAGALRARAAPRDADGGARPARAARAACATTSRERSQPKWIDREQT